jgi:hypothetical protein
VRNNNNDTAVARSVLSNLSQKLSNSPVACQNARVADIAEIHFSKRPPPVARKKKGHRSARREGPAGTLEWFLDLVRESGATPLRRSLGAGAILEEDCGSGFAGLEWFVGF